MKTISTVSVPDPLSARMESLGQYRQIKDPLRHPWIKTNARRAWALPPDELATICLRYTPAERLALQEIAANADIIMVGKRPFLLTPVSQGTLDTLMHLDSELDDLENDDEGGDLNEDMEEDDPPEDNGDRELDTSDDEPNRAYLDGGAGL